MILAIINELWRAKSGAGSTIPASRALVLMWFFSSCLIALSLALAYASNTMFQKHTVLPFCANIYRCRFSAG